ncbi:hypothetical protein ABZ619_23930 [Streptomyces sp. NPDC007851]|uniref:hypothetical protein n=1 Tax=Streptomyces sp. NPDC007851 TaxID=3155008 RepID=UPI0033CD8FE0
MAGARGGAEACDALSEEIVRWAVPRGAHGARGLAPHARGLAALGRGDFETAYRHTSVITPAETFALYQPNALNCALDLVEAAARTGRPAEAAARAAVVRASLHGPALAPVPHAGAGLRGADRTRRRGS